MRSFRLGTRGSKLALAQAESVKHSLLAADPSAEVEIVTIRTSGDKGDRDRLGAFVHELQHAVLDGEVDFALHCLKDLPTAEVEGLRLAAFLEREDPRDALIGPSAGLDSLPEGALVGAGSVRRSSQLLAARADLRFKPLLGNVDTRLRKLAEGEYQGIVLALAGLKRVGLPIAGLLDGYPGISVHPLNLDTMLPAPGQAVLVLECRDRDERSSSLCGSLNQEDVRQSAFAERSFLKAFGGGCLLPVAALASVADASLTLRGLVASPDGKRIVRDSIGGAPSEAAPLGFELAQLLKGEGASEIIDNLAAVAQ